MITGNKGEWSEIYALFKLLGDTKLFVGDAHLNKVEEIFYPIIKIIRDEIHNSFEYEVSGDIVFVRGGENILVIPIFIFAEQAANLLSKIKDATGASFSISETEVFMNNVFCGTLKAKSSSKTDIRIVIHDPQINQATELGFSIKSQLGGNPTLLNAGKTTNFIYHVTDFNSTSEKLEAINNIDTKNKIKDRIQTIQNLGGQLKFIELEQAVFENNLVLIDSLLPHILGDMIKTFFSSNLTSIKDLTAAITASNPLNFNTKFAHSFYEYKIKRFLMDVALGMTPSKVWNGLYDATGGYLIVKDTGDILCYHIYNRNQFEDYLFTNTKLETASSTRHGFGNIYEYRGLFLFKLNLQIRFK